jgi:hypothetical protein
MNNAVLDRHRMVQYRHNRARVLLLLLLLLLLQA